jgi:conjugative transfer signal peptidase TraF
LAPNAEASLRLDQTRRGILGVQFKRRRGVVPAILVLAAAPPALAAVLAATPQPAVLWNQSDSEPRGLYVRVPEPPQVGRIIAFHAPAAAFPYADERMGYLRQVPILKQVAAGQGDVVCTRGNVLSINGRRRAPVAERDGHGRPLPRWDGCRALRLGEFFVYSDRIPNSFDSRYYGPVTRAQIVGVFTPVRAPYTPRGAS